MRERAQDFVLQKYFLIIYLGKATMPSVLRWFKYCRI